MTTKRHARRIAGFCAAIGISRSHFYELPPELRPRTVELGNVVVVAESPEEYLKRVAAAQGGTTLRRLHERDRPRR